MVLQNSRTRAASTQGDLQSTESSLNKPISTATLRCLTSGDLDCVVVLWAFINASPDAARRRRIETRSGGRHLAVRLRRYLQQSQSKPESSEFNGFKDSEGGDRGRMIPRPFLELTLGCTSLKVCGLPE
eukprot:164406-Amphidinium_carterae.1